MIAAESLTEIGHFVKPHGINGELSAVIDRDIDIDSLRCIVVSIDGIFIPFFLRSWRSRGNESVLLEIDDINDEKHAKLLAGKTIYGLTDELPRDNESDDEEDGFYASDFIGWKVFADGVELGTINDIDDSTANVLFIIERPDKRSVFIPVADEFITAIIPEDKSIEMELPTGILDI